jgi:hypothetical protein
MWLKKRQMETLGRGEVSFRRLWTKVVGSGLFSRGAFICAEQGWNPTPKQFMSIPGTKELVNLILLMI